MLVVAAIKVPVIATSTKRMPYSATGRFLGGSRVGKLHESSPSCHDRRRHLQSCKTTTAENGHSWSCDIRAASAVARPARRDPRPQLLPAPLLAPASPRPRRPQRPSRLPKRIFCRILSPSSYNGSAGSQCPAAAASGANIAERAAMIVSCSVGE